MPGRPAEVVGELFSRLAARDLSAAASLWAPGAVYHVTGSHAGARDYGVDDYLAMLATWFAECPDYAVEDFQLTAYGEQVAAAHLVTTGGRAPGTASGLMLFRVEDGLVTEGWGIPTFGGGRQPF